MKPRGTGYNPSVMASRIEPPDSLDFFPTPPWGTRALMDYVFPKVWMGLSEPEHCYSVWEPACGECHIADPLKEYFSTIYASDVHDYGRGCCVGSFVGVGADIARWPAPAMKPDWVITNPPFSLAEEFVRRSLTVATVGVAMLARSVFIESDTRWPLFSSESFKAFCPFSSRLPMVKGQWDPKASSATSYAWFVWMPTRRASYPSVLMIPPEAKERCTRGDDIANFAGPERCGIGGLAQMKGETDEQWKERVIWAKSNIPPGGCYSSRGDIGATFERYLADSAWRHGGSCRDVEGRNRGP